MAPRDPFRYFRTESRELLDGLNQAALELERNGPQAATLDRLLRNAHTLKGAARVVKLSPLADLAHAVEEALEPLRGGAESVPEGMIDRLLKLLDGMERQVAAITTAGAPSAKTVPPPSMEGPVTSPVPHLDTVRLEVAELDSVLDGLREAVRLLSAGTPEQASRELLVAHARAERLRLLPAALLFDFLERVARDAAATLGKPVRFVGIGGDQRLDAPVLSALQDALQHVVRNAVAHGLETAAGRSAAGKIEQGLIRVEIKREGNAVVLSCQDDGQGIDPAQVRAAVAAHGWLPADAPPTLSMDEAIAWLLRGGLSTSAKLTELSGRGLGLSVLRDSVRRLRGQLSVQSQAGKGTQVEIRMPASLSAFDALAVEAGGVPALIPFYAVRQALLLQPTDIARSPGGDSVLLAQGAAPYCSLASLLGRDAGAPKSRLASVVVQGAQGQVALSVDRILGVREAVVMPLPELAPAHAMASGACLDAEGHPCLVLDPDGLVQAAHARPGAEALPPSAPKLPLLVVDDSMTTRMLEQSILETAGYQVELASSGEEGLAKARASRYALILVDVEMPGMDGFEFLERLRADARLNQIPALLVSSRSSPEDKRRGEAAGARDYIVKGEFDQLRLLGRIRELLA